VAMGQSTYPDPSRPRPIRDKLEYFLKQSADLDLPYRLVKKIPSRGVIPELMGSLVSATNVGERTYFDMRKQVAEYLDKDPPSGGNISDRSNALYWYRKGVLYGDKGAEEKWKQRYYDLGGTDKGMEQSIKSSAPDAALNQHELSKYEASLSTSQKERLDLAREWYSKVYGYNKYTKRISMLVNPEDPTIALDMLDWMEGLKDGELAEFVDAAKKEAGDQKATSGFERALAMAKPGLAAVAFGERRKSADQKKAKGEYSQKEYDTRMEEINAAEEVYVKRYLELKSLRVTMAKQRAGTYTGDKDATK